MRLYLTSYDPWDSSYRSEDGHIRYRVASHQRVLGTGKTAVIYRHFPDTSVPTPNGVLVTERHFLPSSAGPSHLIPELSATCEHGITEEPRRGSFESHEHDFQDWGDHPPSTLELGRVTTHDADDAHFLSIGEVEFHTISSSVIRYYQRHWKTNDFFKRQGSGHYGSDRIFKGSDGNQYMWRMKATVSELYQLGPETGSKAVSEQRHVPVLVARLHNPNVGVAFEKRHPPSLDIFKGGEDMMDLILITFVYIEKVRREREAFAYKGPQTMQTAGQVLM